MPARLFDLALRPQRFRPVRLELDRGLDIFQGDVDLGVLFVYERAVGKGDGGARIEFDCAVQVGISVIESVGQAVREPARLVARDRLRVEFQSARKVLDRGCRITGREICIAAHDIDFGVVDIEGERARQIFNRLVGLANVETRDGTVAIGGCKARVGIDGAGKIPDRSVWSPEAQVRHAPARQRRRTQRHQLDRLSEIGNGEGLLAKLKPRVGAIGIGCRIARCQQASAVEIFDGLAVLPERHEQIAAIVISGWILGKQLHRAIEIVECEFGLAEADVGDGAIVQNGRAPVVGEPGIFERFGIIGERLAGVATHELGRALFRLRRCCAIGCAHYRGETGAARDQRETSASSS